MHILLGEQPEERREQRMQKALLDAALQYLDNPRGVHPALEHKRHCRCERTLRIAFGRQPLRQPTYSADEVLCLAVETIVRAPRGQ